MHNFQTVLGVVAGGLALLSYVPYIAAGDRTTIWLPLVYAFGATIVFVLSLKYGVGGTRKLDMFCVLGAILGIAGWAVTKNPQVALYLSIFASACGFLPTIKKAYLAPKTESALSWSMSGMAAALNLFAVSSLALHVALYPIYIFIFDGAIAFLTVFPKFLRQINDQR